MNNWEQGKFFLIESRLHKLFLLKKKKVWIKTNSRWDSLPMQSNLKCQSSIWASSHIDRLLIFSLLQIKWTFTLVNEILLIQHNTEKSLLCILLNVSSSVQLWVKPISNFKERSPQSYQLLCKHSKYSRALHKSTHWLYLGGEKLF